MFKLTTQNNSTQKLLNVFKKQNFDFGNDGDFINVTMFFITKFKILVFEEYGHKILFNKTDKQYLLNILKNYIVNIIEEGDDTETTSYIII